MTLADAFGSDRAKAEAAVDEVFARICSQETLEPEAPSVVPQLIDLLDSDAVAIKPFVLSVLGTIWELAVDGQAFGVFPPAVDFVPAEQRPPVDTYPDLLSRTRKVFESRLSSFLALLDHADPAVRSRVARVLAFTGEHRPEAAARLGAAYARETHREVRATQILALGALGVAPANNEDDDLCRACQIIAAAWVDPAAVDDPTWADLEEIARRPRLHLEYFRWLRGAIAGLAGDALSRLLVVDRDRAAESLVQAIRVQATTGPEASGAEPGEDWPLPQMLAEYLIFQILRDFDGRGSEVLVDELDPLQRKVLGDVGAELRIFTWAQRRCGIPLRPFDLPRYLGHLPAGPLDRTMALILGDRTEAWPLWKWLRFAHRNGLEDALVDRLVERLSRRALFDLYRDVATGFYDPANRGPEAPVPFAARLAARQELRDAAAYEAYAHELLSGEPAVSQAAAAIIPLLQLARDAGRDVDARLDPLIELLVAAGGGLRTQVLDMLPADRRARFEQIPPRTPAIPPAMRRFLEQRNIAFDR